MKRRGGSGPVSGPLEIKAGGTGWQLVSVLSSAVGVTRLAREHNHVAAVAGWCLMGLLLAVLLTAARMVRLKAQGALLRLDDAGITGADGRTAGWGEIAEVREVKGNGLAFLPAAPAELPVFAPVLFPASARGVARRRTERFGTPLVLFPVALDASKEDIVAAVRRFGGGIPVTGADGQTLTA
ncbi:hypothetical protein [Actinacidiphila bryophytorum]|uniref:Uncharacterized protein n=1 Tax=Actinacidiphila bryophytorum TaxID=1436133 RepID=A0A9W4E3Z8_9ACTN|nr:hypothetical protein [Actinacidiphila bryophytorum]MBM9434602.1 hypothetical protein [Actinacidiphila bryophytorum]MBN6543257.1 hypothetical protein [Actinacidiphila bryophytorum]CAG7627972.1 conserved hypothetical protein [Actinacidiphila bryophytorum]